MWSEDNADDGDHDHDQVAMTMAVVEATKEWCSSLTMGRAGPLSLGIVFGGLNKKYSDDDDDIYIMMQCLAVFVLMTMMMMMMMMMMAPASWEVDCKVVDDSGSWSCRPNKSQKQFPEINAVLYKPTNRQKNKQNKNI